MRNHFRCLSPAERLKLVPAAPSHLSMPLGWSDVCVEHIPNQPSSVLTQPPLVNHFLVLQGTPTLSSCIECDGVTNSQPLIAGSVLVVPQGAESRYRWEGVCTSTHFQLSSVIVAKAALACNLDPAKVTFRPVVFGLPHPCIVASLNSLRDELLAGGPGGRLCAESMANVLAVQMIRHLASGPAVRRLSGGLRCQVLREVEEYIMANLGRNIGLAELAEIAHLSEYHFARLFKQSTGETPHQFVIARRIDRAKQLINQRQLTLAGVATDVGFTDQSHFTRHFKRLVGITPKQFA